MKKRYPVSQPVLTKYFLMGFLSIVFLFVLSWSVFMPREQAKTKSRDIEVYKDDILVQKLYDRVKVVSFVFDSDIINDYYYTKESFLTKDMDPLYKKSLAYFSLQDYEVKTISKDNGDLIYQVHEKDLKKAYQRLFGLDYDYPSGDFYAGCMPFTYQEEKQLYTWEGYACGNNQTKTFQRIVTSFSKDGNYLYLEEAIAFVLQEGNKQTIYTDRDYQNKQFTTENFELTKENAHIFSHYRYTFVQQGGAYYFKGIELVK